MANDQSGSEPGQKLDLPSEIKDALDRIRSEISVLRDRLVGGGGGAEAASGGSFSTRLGQLEAEIERLTGRVKDSGRKALDQIEDEVEERPLASVAVAFGLGFLAAKLFRR